MHCPVLGRSGWGGVLGRAETHAIEPRKREDQKLNSLINYEKSGVTT